MCVTLEPGAASLARLSSDAEEEAAVPSFTPRSCGFLSAPAKTYAALKT